MKGLFNPLPKGVMTHSLWTAVLEWAWSRLRSCGSRVHMKLSGSHGLRPRLGLQDHLLQVYREAEPWWKQGLSAEIPCMASWPSVTTILIERGLLGLPVHGCIHILGRMRQENCHEFKAGWHCTVRPRSAKAIQKGPTSINQYQSINQHQSINQKLNLSTKYN